MRMKFTFRSLLLASALLIGNVNVWAEDKVVTLDLTDHMNILGGKQYEGFADGTLLFVNDSKQWGAAPIMTFMLDDEFDASKIISATLKLYVTSKPTDKSRSGQLNVFGLNELPATTGTGWGDSYQFPNGTYKYYYQLTDNTRNFFSQNYTIYSAFTSVDHATKGNDSYMAVSQYNDIDITEYIKGLTNYNGGENIYIGLNVNNDFSADTYIGGLGNANPAKIELVYSTSVLTSYTVQFRDENGDAIEGKDDITGIAISVGMTYNGNAYHDSFFVNGEKYIYLEGDETKTAEEDADLNVITLKFRKANIYSWNVKSSLGKILKSGTGFEDESITVPYNAYYLLGTDLYKVNGYDDSQKQYNVTFKLDEDNKEISISASKDAENVIFYSEAEDIEGMVATNDGNAKIRCSDSKGAYATETVNITSLPAGKYKISGFAWGNEDKNGAFTLKAGEKTVATFATAASTVTVKTNDEFTLTTTTDITIDAYGNAGSSPKVLDFIYIQKTGESETVILKSSANLGGYKTFYNANASYEVDNTATIYKAAVEGDVVVLTEVEGNVVPAGKAVLLKTTANDYIITLTQTEKESEGDFDGNELEATEDAGTQENAYILARTNANDLGFYQFSGEFKAGEVYLPVEKSLGIKYIAIAVGGVATAVETVEAAEAEAGATYNVAGQQVGSDYKGIVIKNGKKYLNK